MEYDNGFDCPIKAVRSNYFFQTNYQDRHCNTTKIHLTLILQPLNFQFMVYSDKAGKIGSKILRNLAE